MVHVLAGSASLALGSRKVFQPVKSLPLNRGLNPSSLSSPDTGRPSTTAASTTSSMARHGVRNLMRHPPTGESVGPVRQPRGGRHRTGGDSTAAAPPEQSTRSSKGAALWEEPPPHCF